MKSLLVYWLLAIVTVIAVAIFSFYKFGAYQFGTEVEFYSGSTRSYVKLPMGFIFHWGYIYNIKYNYIFPEIEERHWIVDTAIDKIAFSSRYSDANYMTKNNIDLFLEYISKNKSNLNKYDEAKKYYCSLKDGMIILDGDDMLSRLKEEFEISGYIKSAQQVDAVDR